MKKQKDDELSDTSLWIMTEHHCKLSTQLACVRIHIYLIGSCLTEAVFTSPCLLLPVFQVSLKRYEWHLHLPLTCVLCLYSISVVLAAIHLRHLSNVSPVTLERDMIVYKPKA